MCKRFKLLFRRTHLLTTCIQKSVKAKYKNEVIAHRGSLLDLEGLKEQLSKQQV